MIIDFRLNYCIRNRDMWKSIQTNCGNQLWKRFDWPLRMRNLVLAILRVWVYPHNAAHLSRGTKAPASHFIISSRGRICEPIQWCANGTIASHSNWCMVCRIVCICLREINGFWPAACSNWWMHRQRYAYRGWYSTIRSCKRRSNKKMHCSVHWTLGYCIDCGKAPIWNTGRSISVMWPVARQPVFMIRSPCSGPNGRWTYFRLK